MAAAFMHKRRNDLPILPVTGLSVVGWIISKFCNSRLLEWQANLPF
jgi:hypothetical protein